MSVIKFETSASHPSHSDPYNSLPTQAGRPRGEAEAPLRNRDRDRLERKLEQHQGLIAKLSKGYFRNRQDQEDLASAVCLAACRKWSCFDSRLGTFGTWIGALVRSEASAMRKKAARSPKTISCDSAIDAAIAEEPKSEVIDEVEERMEAIPAPYRRALACVTVLGMSCREAGALLGATESTIRTYVWRARKCLAALATDREVA